MTCFVLPGQDTWAANIPRPSGDLKATFVVVFGDVEDCGEKSRDRTWSDRRPTTLRPHFNHDRHQNQEVLDNTHTEKGL